jgi:hypothetical protein
MKKVIVNVVNLFAIFGLLFFVGGCKKKDKPDQSKAFVKYYGGLLEDKGMEVLQTSDGGYVIAGTTNSGDGPGDILVIKTDNEGNEIWHQTLGKASVYDECGSIAVMPDGGYVVVGTSSIKSNRVFDVTALEVSKDSTKMFAARMNALGGVIWTKYYDNPSNPYVRIGAFGKSVVVSPNGECFLSGMVDSSYNVSGNLLINLNLYAFIVDKNGVLLKVGGFDMIPFQYGTDDENDYAVSAIQAIDIGLGTEYIISSSTIISGTNTPRLVRCRLNGIALTQNNAPINSSWGKGTYTTAGQITRTADNKYMLVGTKVPLAGGSDFYMVKLNSIALHNTADWTYGDMSGFNEVGVSIYPTNDGGYVLLGTTNSTAYTQDAAKLTDVLMIKVSENGVEQWHRVFGGRGNDSATRVIQTSDGGYLVCGTIAFGDDVSNTGASNSITLIKLNSDGDLSNVD